MLGRGFAPGPNDLPRGGTWLGGRLPRAPVNFSVGDGFKFGCGFMLAVGISLFGLFLAASVIFFVAALAGVPVPGATP